MCRWGSPQFIHTSPNLKERKTSRGSVRRSVTTTERPKFGLRTHNKKKGKTHTETVRGLQRVAYKLQWDLVRSNEIRWKPVRFRLNRLLKCNETFSKSPLEQVSSSTVIYESTGYRPRTPETRQSSNAWKFHVETLLDGKFRLKSFDEKTCKSRFCKLCLIISISLISIMKPNDRFQRTNCQHNLVWHCQIDKFGEVL